METRTMTFAEDLRRVIGERGVSVETAGHQIGVTYRTMQRWLAGKAQMPLQRKAANEWMKAKPEEE